MILRSSLATLASLLLSNAAWALPVLRAEISVSAPLVTVGDMFADAGDLAETALFRAPQPGTSGLVPISDIRAALARVGVEQFDPAGLDGSRVTRSAIIVDQTMLTELIARDLMARGIMEEDMSVDALFATPVQPINADAVDKPVEVISLRYLPGSGAFSARFAIAGVDQPLDVSGTIDFMVEAPHIAASLPAGTLLTAADIEMRPVSLKYVESQGTVLVDDLIGKTLLRQSRQGMMLRLADVTTPALVSKNDVVTIYYRKGPMTLTVKGQAVSSGANGAPVQVLNLMSKRVISATVIAAGAVEVGADPLAIAGL